MEEQIQNYQNPSSESKKIVFIVVGIAVILAVLILLSLYFFLTREGENLLESSNPNSASSKQQSLVSVSECEPKKTTEEQYYCYLNAAVKYEDTRYCKKLSGDFISSC